MIRCSRPFAILLVVSTALGGAITARGERWTNVIGSTSVEASFLGMFGDRVLLMKNDGQRISVKLSDLNAEGRILAEELETKRKAWRVTRQEEIREATRAADTTRPLDVKEPLVPLTDSMTLAESVNHINQQIKAGHPEILWDAVPPSWRGDINGLIQHAATKVEPGQWQPLLDTMEKLKLLLTEKKTFILGHPSVQQAASTSPIPLDQSYDANVGLFTTIFDPELWKLESLKTMDLGVVLAERGPRIGGFILRLKQYAIAAGVENEFTPLDKMQIEQTQTDRAVVTTPTPQGDKKVVWVPVEGRWVPEDIAKDWKKEFEKAHGRLDQGNPTGEVSPLVMAPMILGVVNSQIDTLLATDSQPAFDQAVGQIMVQMMTQMQGLPIPGLAPPMPAGGGGPGNRPRRPGAGNAAPADSSEPSPPGGSSSEPIGSSQP